jgi:hypothetical protein
LRIAEAGKSFFVSDAYDCRAVAVKRAKAGKGR